MTREDVRGRYAFSIFDVCSDLHMSKSGASDPLSTEAINRWLLWLDMRLKTWRPAPARTHRYDDSVKRLIRATLGEYQAEWVALIADCAAKAPGE